MSKSDSNQNLVLVVDDQESVCQTIGRYLTRKGFLIETAGSGREALDKVMRHPPVAIVSDIRMPDMDGMELLNRVMACDPDMVVILATGVPSMEVTIEALRAGATDFLPKPVDMKQLYSSLSRGVERRKARLASQQREIQLESKVRKRTRELSDTLEKLQSVNEQLSEAYDGSIELLRRTSALRDNDTGDHIDRIRLFSGEVAQKLGLSADDIRLIKGASPMHDIGKIGIPDQILQKPGKLTPEEFDIMKTHTLIGGQILGGYKVPLLQASEQIALTHHERWNGKGYPYGLAGGEIPLFGRIVAVVDVWDALTHERCYKRAFTIEEALKIIREERGQHFDPDVLDAFLESLPRIQEIEHEVIVTCEEAV